MSRPYLMILSMLLVLLVLLVHAPTSVQAGTVRVVGLSKSGNGKQTMQQIVALALKTGPGEELQIFDARERKRIAAIAIPEDPKYARVERRLPFLSKPMHDLKTYTDAMPSAKSHEPDVIHGVAFLDEVGALAAKFPHQDIRVLLVGSAWFTAPGATEAAAYRGTYPSDGLILDDRSTSFVGTANLRDLTGVAVSYCMTEGTADFLNAHHRDRVERAWSLEIAERGGSLVTFSADQKTCWEGFAADNTPEPHRYTIDREDAAKRYMYRPEDTAPPILAAPPIKTIQTAQPRSEAAKRREAERFRQRASTSPPTRRDGTAWMGIQWAGAGVDLDLYVRCDRRMPFLFFGNSRSAEGQHNLDYRSGTGDGFETVDLTAACPDITKAEVFVNYYEGALRHGPKGIFAIEFAGKFYKSDFAIAAKTGNKAGGLSRGLMRPPHWVRIDLAKVLRLPTAEEGRSVTGTGSSK